MQPKSQTQISQMNIKKVWQKTENGLKQKKKQISVKPRKKHDLPFPCCLSGSQTSATLSFDQEGRNTSWCHEYQGSLYSCSSCIRSNGRLCSAATKSVGGRYIQEEEKKEETTIKLNEVHFHTAGAPLLKKTIKEMQQKKKKKR